MTDLKKIDTKTAPQAIGPYSQAIKCGDLIFCSGQIPLDPETGKLIEGSIQEQTARVLNNLKNVLEASGSALNRVVKTTVYLQDLNDFSNFNEAYGKFFLEPFPARVTIQAAKLPLGARVEIDAIAGI